MSLRIVIGDDDDMITTGDALREQRVASGLRLRELARQIEMTPHALSDIEHNRKAPTDQECQSIRTAIGRHPTEVET